MRKLLTSAMVLTGLGLAACYPPPPPPPPMGPGPHIRWCLVHHPGYNPNTNLFPDAYGYMHPCRGPW